MVSNISDSISTIEVSITTISVSIITTYLVPVVTTSAQGMEDTLELYTAKDKANISISHQKRCPIYNLTWSAMAPCSTLISARSDFLLQKCFQESPWAR